MSQRDGFSGGFVVGAVVGGIAGGLLGALLASRATNKTDEERSFFRFGVKGKDTSSDEGIEMARRSLEDKIAQLNLAIDDVRQRMEEHQESSESSQT